MSSGLADRETSHGSRVAAEARSLAGSEKNVPNCGARKCALFSLALRKYLLIDLPGCLPLERLMPTFVAIKREVIGEPALQLGHRGVVVQVNVLILHRAP